MKNIKTYILIGLLTVGFAACDAWFDGALPKDAKTEDVHFKDEISINTVLNGFYTTMASDILYGRTLTKAEIELMAHYYYFTSGGISGDPYQSFRNIGTYQYSIANVKQVFANVWKSAYSLIYDINRFILKLETTTVLTKEKRDLYLGEAYGLRAYLHFDLFRLFSGTNTAQMIPYNHSPEVVPHSPVPSVDAFKQFVFADLNKAKELLQNDPIKTQIPLLSAFTGNQVESTQRFYKYSRNYRFNAYAALALEARMRMFFGETEQAATIAKALLNDVMGQNKDSHKPFYWTDKAAMQVLGQEYDYICYSEVLFGIYDKDKYTRWKQMTEGSISGSVYSVADATLRQIYRHDAQLSSINSWEDMRAHQWHASAETVNPSLISNKFSQWYGSQTSNTAANYMQPMIRLSEMYLIVVENQVKKGEIAEAAQALNDLRFYRGTQYGSLPDPLSVTADLAYDIIETEYYKEFYGEGQTFFFMKRRERAQILDQTGVSSFVDMSLSNYVVPIPEDENNN